MADDSSGRRPFWPVSNGQRWTFKSTLVYTLNPELMHIDPLLLMYRFGEVTIYLGFAFVATNFYNLKLIIDYQVED